MALYTGTPHVATNSDGSAAELTPANLDPATHPIISRHWFGVEPPRAIGPIAAEVVADLRFRRKVIRLHRRGPRAVTEYLAELGAELGVQTPIDQKLDAYLEVGAAALEAAGGDEFWPAPVHGVER